MKDRKLNYWLGVMCMMCLFMIGMLFPVKVHAEIASGTSGTCSWEISDDGTLTINPTDEVSGMMNSYVGENVPWYSNRSQIKKVVVEPGVKTNTGCYQMFSDLSNCTEMDLANLDTSNATNMDRMFYNCSALTSLDVSRFDTSKVTSMNSMFYNCSKLTSLDVSGFDTSKVMNMSSMFKSCSKLTSLDVSGFDTTSVTDMFTMFYECKGLTSLDVSGFDTSNVTNMQSMFYGCTGLTSLDVFSFDTSKVTNMGYMFQGCSGLTSLDISGFDTSNVTTMSGMFRGCSTLTSLDVSNFNTSKVADISSMFRDCNGLTSLDVSSFDTSKVTNMSHMFQGCSSLTGLDVSGFDTSKVATMYQMFYNCSSLTSLDLSSFDTSNVTNMSQMFYSCSGLTSLDVSGFDTSNVTDMSDMFYNCSKLTSLDVFNFDTSNVTTMCRMFQNCSALTSLDVSGFDTSKVTNMDSMFSSCKALTNLNVSGFDTSNVTNMGSMFQSCSKLSSITLGENFSFAGKNITSESKKAILLTPPSASTTGKWIRKGKAYGPYTPAELRDGYTSEMAGEWVWETFADMPVKYAVQLYGIHEAVDQDGYTMGLTFGPAVGGNYIRTYKSHTPTGTTESGNSKRCIHNDDWETIIYWNYKDPEVYRDCIANGCTHSVELSLSENFRNASFNPSYTTGDGPGQLYYELYKDSNYQHLRWNPLVEGGDTYYGTNKGGWGASRVRAMLNGADELTMKTSDSHYCSNAYNVTFAVENYIGSDTLIAAFPQELQHAIGKQEIKYDSVYNAKTAENLKTSYDKLWLLSPNDIWTETQNVTPDYAHPGEGTRLSRFASNTASRSTSAQNITVSYRINVASGNSAGSASYYWLRSLVNGMDSNLLYVGSSGYISTDTGGSYARGIAPCFSLIGSDSDNVKIVLMTNGGFCETGTLLYDQSDPAQLPSTTRPRYELVEWNTSADGSGTAYQPGDTVPGNNGDVIVLYAIWQRDNTRDYTVKHYQQNATLDGYTLAETENFYDVIGASVTPAVKTYEGFLTPTAQTVTVASDDSTVVEYYYDRQTYTIRFDRNTGTSGQMADQTFVYGVSQALSQNTFSKEGSLFTGWNTEPDGTGTTYADKQALALSVPDGTMITLYAQWLDNSENALDPSQGVIYVTAKAGQTVIIPDLPAGTTYTIEEMDTPSGWEYKTGSLESGMIGKNETKNASVTNKYAADGQIDIIAHKRLEGRDLSSGEFAFQLLRNGTVIDSKTNEGIDTEPYEYVLVNEDDDDPVMQDNPWYGTAPIRFNTLYFTQADVGKTYTYTIKEVEGSDPNVNYDTHTETVTVRVTDAGGGMLDVQAVYDSDGALFNNTLKDGSLTVSKATAEGSPTNKDFTYSVLLKDRAGNPLTGTYPVYKKLQNYGTEAVGIEGIAYSYTQNLNADGTKASDYGNSWTNSNIRGTGREAANSQAHVVTIDGATHLTVTIRYGGESASYDWVCMWEGSHPTYTAASDYGSSKTGKLGGGSNTSASNTKVFEVDGDTVTFAFKSDSSGVGDGYGYYAVIESHEEEVATGFEESVFPDMSSLLRTAVSHTDNISDSREKHEDFANGGSYVATSDIVTIPGADQMHVKLWYTNPRGYFYIWTGEHQEVNTIGSSGNVSYSADCQPSTAYKAYSYTSSDQNNILLYDEFDVPADTLSLVFYCYAIPSTSGGYNENTNFGYFMEVSAGDPNADLSDAYKITLKAGESLDISGLPGGTAYEVIEQPESGWEIISDTGSKGTISTGERSTANFVNAYRTEGSATITATKHLTGGDLSEYAFNFELLNEDMQQIQFKQNDALGNVIFDPIYYENTDSGKTFTYYIREVSDPESSITFDESVYTVNVAVQDNGQGELETTVTYPDGEPVFENSAAFSITVGKTVGGSMGEKNKQFRFELALSGDHVNGSQMTYDKGGSTGNVQLTSGKYAFTLAHNETITISGIPAGSTYTVTELDANKNAYLTQVDAGTTGTLSSDVTIGFTNVRDVVVPTGRNAHPIIPVLIFGLGSALGAGYIIQKKRKPQIIPVDYE